MFILRHIGIGFFLFVGFPSSQGLAQTGPFDDPTHCQPFDDTLFSMPGDRGHNWLPADDFVADGGTLSQVRVWGFYYDLWDGDGCAPPLTVDRFLVSVFENDPITSRQPGTLVAWRFVSSQRVPVTGSQIEISRGLVMYQIDLTVEPAITGLVAGQVYWLEVSNDLTTIYGQPVSCTWFWSEKNQTPTSYFWMATPTMCPSGEPYAFDQALCLNFDLGQSPVGAMPGACCTCDGLCTERTLEECDQAGGHWDIDTTTCAGVVCPIAPPNDNCADGPPLVGEGEYVIPQFCATTDGYGPIPTVVTDEQIEGDVWYKFIAPPGCQLVINSCFSDSACFNNLFAVYHNPDDPTVCPPCPLNDDPNGAVVSAATLAGVGQAGCFRDPPGNGVWHDLIELGRHALPGECFYVRAGNIPGDTRVVERTLAIDCVDLPPALEPDPTGIDKVRFVSFRVPPESTAPTAIRVNLTSLYQPMLYRMPSSVSSL